MSSPFMVKTFPQRGDVATALNDWFKEMADDTTQEFDIRQILNTDIDLLVFYEVAPAEVHPEVKAGAPPCCDTCGDERDLRHVCKNCDTRGERG